jgi:hypothetical protein
MKNSLTDTVTVEGDVLKTSITKNYCYNHKLSHWGNKEQKCYFNIFSFRLFSYWHAWWWPREGPKRAAYIEGAIKINLCCVRRSKCSLMSKNFVILILSVLLWEIHCNLLSVFQFRHILYSFSPCILISIKVFSPTDSQLDSFKSNFKFALKLTLKSSYMFRCKTPSSGSTLSDPC